MGVQAFNASSEHMDKVDKIQQRYQALKTSVGANFCFIAVGIAMLC